MRESLLARLYGRKDGGLRDESLLFRELGGQKIRQCFKHLGRSGRNLVGRAFHRGLLDFAGLSVFESVCWVRSIVDPSLVGHGVVQGILDEFPPPGTASVRVGPRGNFDVAGHGINVAGVDA